MQVGQTSLPISEAILGMILIISLICNIFLFSRGHQSYSIKYQLFLNDKNFRKAPGLATLVQGIYKSFFVLPFLLLLAIAISRALYNPGDLPVIFVNGLIVLLITYPLKTSFYYVKMTAMWILAITSQFISLFLQSQAASTDYYTLLCAIFYPINSVLFCLALLSRESQYWEIEEALTFEKVEKELGTIYPSFVVKAEETVLVQQKKKKKRDSRYLEDTYAQEKSVFRFTNIPFIFNGGIYGALCRNRIGWKFTLLYLISLCILAINAVVIWSKSDSILGVIGLITNFIYDLFVFSFNILATPERSIRNVFILVFAGRLLSFIFGKQLWIFGYCVLYFLVGIFIGKILVNSRLPLRNIKKQQKSKKQINAFRTPQFVLFILTVQIIFLVLASSFGVGNASPTVDYSSQVSIPLWQFALIAVIATWIVIAFLASSRMYQRHLNNIKDHVQFFFGSKKIREYHIYFFVTYVFIIGLGLYCYHFLKNSVAFFTSVFLPLIYWSALKLFNQWKNNEYQILANIPEYNRRVEKRAKIIQRKQRALSKQTQKKADLDPETSKILIKTNQDIAQNSRSDFLIKNEINVEILSNDEALDQIELLLQQKNQCTVLQDWREMEGSLSLLQVWSCLTPSDKRILIMILALFLLFTGFILTTYIASQSIFGVFVVICLISALSVMPYYRFACTFKELSCGEYVWSEIGLVFGIVYWSFYSKQTGLAMVWAVVQIIAFSVMLTYGIAKKIDKKLVYCLIINVFLVICFICLFLALTNDAIIAVIVTITLFMICVGAVPVAFQHIQGHLPNYIKIISGVIIGAGIAGLSIASVLLNFASNFAIFSFVMVCIYLILVIIGLSIFYQKQNSKYDNPMVYSAYGQPIYRFDSSTQQLKSSKNHKVILDLASAVLVVYGAVVALIFNQKQWAIYSLALYCSHTFFQDILFSLKTYQEISAKPEELTEELMLMTLKELKQKYMIDFTHNKYSEELQKIKDEKKAEAEEQTDTQKLDAKWLQIGKINNECIKNREQQEKFLFFWIALIEFHIFSKEKQKMTNFLNHVKQIQEELIQLGIFIDSLSYAIDFFTKYQLVTQQVDNLNPVDYISFNALLKKQEMIAKENKHLQLAEGDNIQKQQEEKEKRMYENLQLQMKRPTSEKINQFQDMIAALGKKLYEDSQFPRTVESLGDLEGEVQKWRRPSSKEVLVKGNISPYDVRQGKIGNCYLISALGVLGEQWILRALGQASAGKSNKAGDKKIWTNQKGAYMVRFYKFSKEIFVTIDDYLPVDSHDDYVFAKSQQEYELWPSIIEKAYAKLYGGYQNIIKGKCHSVLAQFTNGIPFQYLTKDYEANPNGLWQKIISAKSNNYLMAAGSQAHEMGDRAFSKRNIVFGHAYSVLDAREVEGYKLMKLKNPHGSGEREWSGDFSDGSQFMNDRMMQLLGHEKKDDGVFWMKLSLYLCAIFDDELFKKQIIEGQFNQENSYGTPSKSQQTFRNPQYGIVATKKSTLFVNLTQKDRSEDDENTFQGKNTIFLRCYKSNGKRISNYNKNEPICGLPQQSRKTISVSIQVQLQADSFPYTFTLYTSCLNEGDTGAYKLDIFCSDKEFKLIQHEEFDRQNF